MRHFFGGRQLRAAALLGITTALSVSAAFVTTGQAKATTTTSQNHANCTNTPGGCVFTSNGSATFRGEFDTPAVVVDDTSCPPQVLDGTDTICGHFSIDPVVNGLVTASIAFNEENDLDFCAYNTEDIALTCSTGSGGSESVTFGVTGGRHYEVRILPISYPFPGPMPPHPGRRRRRRRRVDVRRLLPQARRRRKSCVAHQRGLERVRAHR
jgi:hypothetical protein